MWLCLLMDLLGMLGSGKGLERVELRVRALRDADVVLEQLLLDLELEKGLERLSWRRTETS